MARKLGGGGNRLILLKAFIRGSKYESGEGGGGGAKYEKRDTFGPDAFL